MESEVLKKLDDIAERMTKMEVSHTNLIGSVEKLDERLFGNGQPGVVDKLWTRISHLEYFFWSAIGGGTVIVVIIGWLLAYRK